MQQDNQGRPSSRSIMTVNVTSAYITGQHQSSMQKKDRTTGNTRNNSPPPVSPLSSDTKWCRAVTPVFGFEWSRQAQQSGVSPPLQSRTSPGDRTGRGLLPSAAASAGHARRAPATICWTMRCRRFERRRGSSHFGSGFGQTIAAYQRNNKINSRQGSPHNNKKQQETNKNNI